MPSLGTHVFRRWLHGDGDWRWSSHAIVRITPAFVYVEFDRNERRLRRADLESGIGAQRGAARYYAERSDPEPATQIRSAEGYVLDPSGGLPHHAPDLGTRHNEPTHGQQATRLDVSTEPRSVWYWLRHPAV